MSIELIVNIYIYSKFPGVYLITSGPVVFILIIPLGSPLVNNFDENEQRLGGV